jgi:protoporphyrinogen oxidase
VSAVVVAGAGPAGLAAAYRLSESPAAQVHLVERAPQPGGLAAGFRHGGITLDYGPHRLHVETDPDVLDDLRALLGDDLTLKRRRGLIRLNGRYLPYPVKPRTVLGLGLGTAARLALGALGARFNGAASQTGSESYEGALTSRLGAPLYALFYGPFAEKVWGRPGTEIAADQAERRVNQRGPLDLLRQALGRGRGRSYYYPRGGFGQIPEAYARALATRPSVRLDCNTTIERITWSGETISSVGFQGGSAEPVDHLVWSAPLPALVNALDPAPPVEVLSAAHALRYRAVVVCYVVLERDRVGTADTYYFPERRFPFNRVIEQKNFSAAMAPAGRTVLGMDIACDPDDEVFLASDEALRARVVPALEEAGLVRAGEVREVFSRRFRSAYPLYERDYAPHLAGVHEWLARFQNLWLIGRQGLYLHNNTHHSLLMGYRAADAILARRRVRWPAALAEFRGFRVAD